MPSVGPTLGPAIYTSMSTVITRCNRDSQNLYAESLIKRMGYAVTGQPGSWLNGAAIVRIVVRDRLQNAALSSQLKIADGSGLSRENAIAPATLTAWLNSFHNDKTLGPMFIGSLAVGGQSGTLRQRFTTADLHGATVRACSTGHEVQAGDECVVVAEPRARPVSEPARPLGAAPPTVLAEPSKSRFINGVSCLSGYVTKPDGRARCFSIMINDLDVPTSRAKKLQDAIVRAIADDMAREPERVGTASE